jgi:hypothetical protein
MSNQLTPHFSQAELTVTGTGIDNTPDAPHLEALTHLAESLEALRTSVFGGQAVLIDSAYRSPAVNAAVGGVPNSAHEQGHAADIRCPSFGTPYECAQAIQKWADANNVAFDQCIFEENAWVHWSPQNTEFGQRRQYLTFDGTTYTDGIHPI